MEKLLYIFLGLSLMFGCSDDSDSDSNESDTVEPVNDCTISSTFSSITIGDQIWTNTNLDITTYCDGTLIPQVAGGQDSQEWRNLTTGAWTYAKNCNCGAPYEFSEIELHSFGKLYNWYAVAGIHDNDDSTPNKKFAPDSWRVPTYNDYQVLFDNNSTTSLRATGTVENGDGLWFSGVWSYQEGTNETGFSAIPAGARNPNGSGNNNGGYANLGYYSYYWTSNSGDGIENAWLVIMSSQESPNDYEINHGGNETISWTQDYSRRNGFSVRLVKDLE
tara:strand:- start:256 stop:1083 length:828 start_codon:yes stop_codon:yes gene_type:complete